MTTDNTTVTVTVQNPQDVELLYWLKQNKTNIENTVGTKLTSFTLSYTEADGFNVSYTKKAATVTAPPTP